VSAHIDDRAAGLAALPASDPERAAAYAHAASCARCREALDEGERLLGLLAAGALPRPSAFALERAWKTVSTQMGDARLEPAPDPVRHRWFTPATLLAAITVSLAMAGVDAVGGALAWKIGVECLLIELAGGAVPLAAFRFIEPEQRGPAVYGAVGAWGALMGQLYLHVRCPVAHEGPHLWAFHFAGVVAAAAIASVLGTVRASSRA
jgi:hypothetical protein